MSVTRPLIGPSSRVTEAKWTSFSREFADQLVILHGGNELIAIGQLGGFAAGVGKDDLVEFLIGLRIADKAGKGRNAGAGRDHVETLAGL
jgi:hypothetical protein